MQLAISKDLQCYLVQDEVASWMAQARRPGDETLVCDRWLAQTPAKRLIYHNLYGDLLAIGGRRVLDVGGGLSSLTRMLADRNDYTLVDLLAHDGGSRLDEFMTTHPFCLERRDWFDFTPSVPYDVVIANDLFPNVDQRLTLFLERYLPVSRELRLTLTWYDQPRFYLTRRVDAEEVLCMLAWNGRATRHAIEPFAARIRNPDSAIFSGDHPSLYPNGRTVAWLVFEGDIA